MSPTVKDGILALSDKVDPTVPKYSERRSRSKSELLPNLGDQGFLDFFVPRHGCLTAISRI